jgi:hypothetical protein
MSVLKQYRRSTLDLGPDRCAQSVSFTARWKDDASRARYLAFEEAPLSGRQDRQGMKIQPGQQIQSENELDRSHAIPEKNCRGCV